MEEGEQRRGKEMGLTLNQRQPDERFFLVL